MSRIRSHLDAIMSGGENREPQPYQAAAPRPAFPRSGSQYSRQPVSQPAPNLQDIHKSLDQLANRISTVSRNNAQQAAPAAQPAVSSQPAFQDIRQEIHNGISQVKQELGNSLDHDLKRIADGIAALQSGQNMHPGYVDQMQAELQNLNIGIRQIAEMQSAAPASQVDLSGVSQSIESGYSEIVQKLDQVLAQRGSELPSLPEINIPDYSNDLKALASRVEEVSRAVVSMSVSAGDIEGHHALERIEARLASLAKAVEAAPAPGGVQFDNQLFADMANHQEMVAAELSRLSQHLETLQGGAAAAGPDYAGELAHNLTALEERIATLADRLDGFISGGAESPAGNGQEILAVLQELVGRVEAIEQLAAQAEHEGHEGEPGSADRLAGLEAQISAIATLLGSAALNPETGETQSPEPGSIAERLYNIEGQIAASRDIVIDMASQAAQAGTGENAAGFEAMQLSQLDEVLAEVRQIREASSGGEQNGGNLGEIAEAIQAISARLDQLEMVQAWPTSQPESDMQFGEQASVQTAGMPAETFPDTSYVPDALEAVQPAADTGFDEHELPQLHDSPPLAPEHEAAHIAPEVGEVQADYLAQQHDDVDGMMAPAADVRPPEAEAEDVPLEPGSGMPDLESLVRRATNRKRAKNEPAAEEPGDDDGINDLMAAARRAAQAASAQAQTRREREAMGVEQPGEKKRFSIGKPSMFSRKRLLTSVAVIALAYAAWAIVPKFLGGSNETEVSQTIPQEQPLAAEESAGKDTTAGEEEIAAAADTGADTGDAAVMDDSPAAGDDMLAEVPQDDAVEETSQPAGGDEVLAAAEPLPDAGAETMPAMAAGSETVAIPDGMPQEIGNAALLQDAAAGDGNALFEIARRYTEGDGVDRNLETAATWYQKAAGLGHGPSQYRLGNFYEKGHGVTADTDKAAEWYSKAAAAGNALAMHNLAVLNVQGLLGSEPDMETAIGWFEKAANLGVKDSQVNLGILYTRGMGVKADLEQAYKWFAIAAKGGDNDAAAKRDTVAKNMRPEQLEKARGEAEIWKPKELSRDANIVALKESWKKGSNLERATLPQKELVRRTQAVLSKLGFDPGPADGIMGAKTEEAIKAYQQKSGLPVDGRITPALLEALSAQAV